MFGSRWQNAPDIWADCFDFTRRPLEAGTYTQSAAEDTAPLRGLDWATGIHDLLRTPAGTLEALLERIFVLPDLKRLDRRAQIFDTLLSMEQKTVSLKRMAEIP